MSSNYINQDYVIPENIIEKMKNKRKYTDREKYKLLDEKYIYKNPYHIMVERVEEKSTQNIYNRSIYIIFKNTSKIIADRINKRRHWTPFNILDSEGNIENSNTTTIGDEIFMEMNPKLCNDLNKYNCFFEDHINNKMINQNKNNHQNSKFPVNQKSLNCVTNVPGFGLSLFRGRNLGQNTHNKSGYIAPHLKRQREEEELNLPKSIKIQNIPNYLTKEEIEDWLSQFRIGKYRLSYIRNKKTDEFKGLVFLNFNFHKEAINSLKFLEGQRLEYNIIEPMLAN